MYTNIRKTEDGHKNGAVGLEDRNSAEIQKRYLM
jgi:hypothetical protein